MCKALTAIEKSNPIAVATLFFSLPNKPITDLNVLHDTTEAYGSKILSFCERSLQRYPPLRCFREHADVSKAGNDA
jgi:hypothetical protein